MQMAGRANLDGADASGKVQGSALEAKYLHLQHGVEEGSPISCPRQLPHLAWWVRNGFRLLS